MTAEKTVKPDQAYNKKVSEMTADEIREKMRVLGLPGLPYPMARLQDDGTGAVEYSVGMVASATEPFKLYSHMTDEQINGLFFRDMPTPSTMFMLRELIMRMQPESDNMLLTVLGEPAAGKTYMFYRAAEVVHPEGAIKIDCGGMNMRELFFRPVIDYGKGVKEQLNAKVAAGTVPEAVFNRIETAFTGAVIRDGGSVSINWDAIGMPRRDKDGKYIEDSEQSAKRAKELLEDIYAQLGISERVNAFGIKMVAGDIIKAWESGRPIVLDEFNKSKKGTLDAFQTFLQFVNGEKGFDTFTAHNPLPEYMQDSDSPKSYTFTRSERRLGWFIGVSGNDESDGDTTHALSESMKTRLKPFYIYKPELRDWKHRLSQIVTGVPLSTLYDMFGTAADGRDAEFAEWLVALRRFGLGQHAVEKIPAHEIHYLKNFRNTIEAIDKLAHFYDVTTQLTKENSVLLMDDAYKNLTDEISSYGSLIAFSFREAIKHFEAALQSTPKVVDPNPSAINFNLSEVFAKFSKDSVRAHAPGWHTAGDNFGRIIEEDIVNRTRRMPMTQAALRNLCMDKGIIPKKFTSGGQPSDDFSTLADLLNFNDVEAPKEILDVRDTVMSFLRDKFQSKLSADADKVVPLAKLTRVINDLNDENAYAGDTDIVLPNDDINTVPDAPVIKAQMVPNFEQEEGDESHELVDFRSVLTSLALPGFADKNMENIWIKNLEDSVETEDAGETEEKNKEKTEQDMRTRMESISVLSGHYKHAINLCFLQVADSQGKPSFLEVIDDNRPRLPVNDNSQIQMTDDEKKRYMLIIGREEISKELQQKLFESGINYIVDKKKEATAAEISNFIVRASEYRAKVVDMDVPEMESLSRMIITAFNEVCTIKSKADKLIPAEVLADYSGEEPAVYSSILKPKVG